MSKAEKQEEENFGRDVLFPAFLPSYYLSFKIADCIRKFHCLTFGNPLDKLFVFA
jgi:hypothetical protein